ncbi:hypothetical protein ACJX0J_008382, partial [Zea mays]
CAIYYSAVNFLENHELFYDPHLHLGAFEMPFFSPFVLKKERGLFSWHYFLILPHGFDGRPGRFWHDTSQHVRLWKKSTFHFHGAHFSLAAISFLLLVLGTRSDV